MSTPPRTPRPRLRPAAAGFSLIELMIALAIALFLIAGMVLIFQNTRSTYTSEKGLSQLEDNERLAMTLIADVIQSAGYYPNPAQNLAQDALPASPDFPTAQNSWDTDTNIAASTNPQGDTISVRYAAAPTDAIMNCMGQTNTSGGLLSWDNTLSVDSNGFLTCQVWDSADGHTTTAELVGGFATGNGIQSMSLLYGVNTGTASNGSCVDSYMTATQVTAGSYWPHVCSVTVSLVFVNPLPPADGSKPTITFQRVIALMNQAGVNNS
ncbi:MAG TPA: PilW family protein [Steroidobacteraceae bacterium]|nr:PilW family protein [Steroidobacteraceae bacterium]